jgi:hypothetical protein
MQASGGGVEIQKILDQGRRNPNYLHSKVCVLTPVRMPTPSVLTAVLNTTSFNFLLSLSLECIAFD